MVHTCLSLHIVGINDKRNENFSFTMTNFNKSIKFMEILNQTSIIFKYNILEVHAIRLFSINETTSMNLVHIELSKRLNLTYEIKTSFHIL